MRRTRIGLLFPLTGEWAWVGRPCLEAVERALELVRERGTLPDHEIELMHGDAPDPKQAADAAGRLIDAGADVLLGTMFSSQALPASEVAARRGILYWEAVAAADALTARGAPGVFRVDTTARAYGDAVADFAADRLAPSWGARPADVRVAIVHLEEPFCASVSEALEGAIARRGLSLAGREPFGSVADIDPLVSRVAALRPDIVFMSAFGPSVTAFGRRVRRDVGPKAVVGNGAWLLAHRVGDLGPDLDGVFAVDTPHISSLNVEGLRPEARATLEWWRERCGEAHSIRTPVDRDLVFLSSLILFEQVLARAASSSLGDLREAALAADVPTGGTILGYGAKFDERGDNTRAFAAMLQWQDGVRHTVHPRPLATADPRTQPLGVLAG